jgi:biotin operon repressor
LKFPESEDDIPPHEDIPLHCHLSIDAEEGFWWDYRVDECPSIHARHVDYGSDGYPYLIDFAYDNPVEIKPDRVNCVRIQMDERIVYSQPAYPFLIRWVLNEKPQNQTQIRNNIWAQFRTEIDRKTIGRHLALLRNLGYPIRHNVDGYYCEGNFSDPQAGIEYKSSAYPLMVLQVLNSTPKTQAAIIRAVQEKYGKKIDRKAIHRNLNLLIELGYPVEKCDKGYSLNK